jgi:hypothetical protein
MIPRKPSHPVYLIERRADGRSGLFGLHELRVPAEVFAESDFERPRKGAVVQII